MAKGKKSKGNNYVSKGERSSVARWVCKQLKLERNGTLEQAQNKLDAHRKGKNTWITIPNPNKNETNKRFIRVPGREVFR